MPFGRFVPGALLASVLCGAMIWPAGATAKLFQEFVDPNPAPGNQFGHSVVALSTGNVVVTSPFDDAGGADAGAVYLYNGATGALISTLRGTSNHNIGSGGVTALSNGNFVILSPDWDNVALAGAGAATWGNGTTGVSGTLSAFNSLVGSTANDAVGGQPVTALTNGNYVVASPLWNNGGVADAGAVTWCNGATGRVGVLSAANSLVGSVANDNVGGGGVTALPNGNYVVASPLRNNVAVVDAGAATWGNGTSGVVGAVSAANSLVGSTLSDLVGNGGVTVLTNGNYVVSSASWDNGGIVNAGAATWCNGTTGLSGPVSAANSLVGSTANDGVGGTAIALTNGHYVVRSANWANGGIANAGAATWGNGTAGVSGPVSAANSLVGSTASDQVGGIVTALTNGNYVVLSHLWNNGAVADVGAATWGNGATGVSGPVSAANSLVGSTAGDNVGISGALALTNGNYVVGSVNWDNGAVTNVGAATWVNGTTGLIGMVSASNSLVGSTANDQVGVGVTALTNGHYVVRVPNWDNAGVVNVGAATWGNGTIGLSGTVSAANSLIGSTTSNLVGNGGVTALTNGNYVVVSGFWDNGAVTNVGAATWGSGTTGITGVVSAANSLVGSTSVDQVGVHDASNGVFALSNGNYLVVSTNWNSGAVTDAGAATWGSGTTGVSGAVSVANSLVGSTLLDYSGGTVRALANGGFACDFPQWDNVAIVNAGAVAWGSGTSAVTGAISLANSLIGTSDSTALLTVVDDVNDTFLAGFSREVGGRVRVGPLFTDPSIESANDIPGDQGGWIRLTLDRSELDVVTGSPAVATYAVWRHLPGTVPADASASLGARPDAEATERLRAALPPGLDVRQSADRLYVVGRESPGAETAAVFPPGTWELVATVPALQQAQYVVAVPTISNAAPNDFIVTSHTTTPSIWFMAAPISGQSVDNLAPATPTLLTGAYSSGQTNLQWAANTENDLGSYRVYRGASAGFTPGPGNLIATVVAPGHGDAGPLGGYYKVSAVDVNSNESGFALLTPGGTTDVDEEGPVAFALHGVRPNPTNGSGLHVAFALPTGAAARLELLDVSGRQVMARDVGSLGAGRHTVNLAQDRRAAPGIYWVRLTQGANQMKTRVAVIE